jgi:hypothetical protein
MPDGASENKTVTGVKLESWPNKMSNK